MTAVTFPLRPPRLAFAICGWRWQNDLHVLKREHVYWHQVQREMYFLRENFVILFCGPQRMYLAVLKIERNESWAANIPLITQFYLNYIFPKIVAGEW